MLAATGSFLVPVLDAQGVSGTLVVLLALNVLRVAGSVGVTHVTARALAQVATLQVHAEGAQATRGAGLELRALIDVPTPCDRRIISEASPTDTLAPSINRYAFFMRWTGPSCRAAVDDLLLFCQTSPERVAFKSVWTHAFKLPRKVSAEGTLTTGWTSSTFVDINTARQTVALTSKTMCANTNRLPGVVKLAFGVGTTEDVFARVSAVVSEIRRRAVALVVSANGVARTSVVSFALDDLNTSDSWVSRCPGRAPAVVASRCVGAYS